ncbi:MAG TPA: hypothetical protein VFA37_00970 [Gaiellaceae bacterium]|nr:hypothetical protein [Gaiellaceae bacterium]
MRRLLAVAVIVGAFIAAPMGTASATDSGSIPFHSRIGKIFGMIAPLNLTGTQVSNSAPASGSLDYNGGPVMPTNTVYTIYWAPSGYQFPDGYSANLNRYFTDLQADNGKDSNPYVNGTQYYEESSSGAKTYVQEHSTFGGTALDTDPLPPLDPVNCPDTPVAAAGGVNGSQSTTAGCVTDAQVQQEISTVVRREGWPVNNTTEFFMFTAPNIGTCFPAQVGEQVGGVETTVTAPLCSFSYFCAYHSAYYDSTLNPNSQVIYANMPYAAQTAGNPVTCDLGEYPNGNPSDPEISVTSHEHNESITDPFGTGWWDSNPNDSAYGDENGDMCAWDFGTTYGPANAEYNETINGDHYLMQLEWDNTTNGCPGSDSSGNPTSSPNYDTPEISLTPNVGYPTAPFKISGLFFNVGDKVASSFLDAGRLWALGSATANSSGQFSLMTKVPSGAKAGTATVTSSGKAGSATASFTVPS